MTSSVESAIEKVTRIWSLKKFSQLVFKEMYGDQYGEFVCGYWDSKGFRAYNYIS